MSKEIADNLSKLIQTFNDKRVISEGEIKGVLTAIVTILGENKKGVESLNSETKQQLETAVASIADQHTNLLKLIKGDLTKSKAEIEKATKEQNKRAFDQLQKLISKIKMPKDGNDGKQGEKGSDGKDGSPDTAEIVRDKLETLKDEERLDASAIKGLERYLGVIAKKGKDIIVGGIRFFENLADVSITTAKKRQDLVAQYNTTNSRWQDGIAITVSTSAPSSPQINDLWVDIS